MIDRFLVKLNEKLSEMSGEEFILKVSLILMPVAFWAAVA